MATRRAGQPRGMEDLFAALNELEAGVAIRVRRAALKETAQQLTKAAKQSVGQFDMSPHARAVLRRALFRKDPRTIERKGAKGKKRKYKPMRYTVSVRRGKQEQAGADLGVYTSGAKKGQSKGVRKHSRDAWWWYFFERGTKERQTRRGLARGMIRPQRVFERTFEAAYGSAVMAGEAKGLEQLQKEKRKLEAKARQQTQKLLKT